MAEGKNVGEVADPKHWKVVLSLILETILPLKNSSYVSPTKFDTLRDLETESNAEEIWSCEICKFVFSDPQAKLLECKRCRDRFWTKCLNKPDEEYDILSKCGVMWFCAPCREKVQKNIYYWHENWGAM